MHGFPGMWYLSVRIWNSWLQHKKHYQQTCKQFNSIQFNSIHSTYQDARLQSCVDLGTLLLQTSSSRAKRLSSHSKPRCASNKIGWEKVQGSPWGDQIPSCSKKVVLCFCVIFWLSQGQETWTVCLRLPQKNELEVALLRKFDSKRFILLNAVKFMLKMKQAHMPIVSPEQLNQILCTCTGVSFLQRLSPLTRPDVSWQDHPGWIYFLNQGRVKMLCEKWPQERTQSSDASEPNPATILGFVFPSKELPL